MIKLDKETKNFITGNVVGIITGIITLYIYYDYIETKDTKRADSPPYNDRPTWFGQMDINNWKPLTSQQINQMRRY